MGRSSLMSGTPGLPQHLPEVLHSADMASGGPPVKSGCSSPSAITEGHSTPKSQLSYGEAKSHFSYGEVGLRLPPRY